MQSFDVLWDTIDARAQGCVGSRVEPRTVGNGLGGGGNRAGALQRRRLWPAAERNACRARGRPLLQPLCAPPAFTCAQVGP